MKQQDVPNLARDIERKLTHSGEQANYIDIRETLLKLWDTFSGQYRYQIPVYVASPGMGIEEGKYL